MHHLTSVRFSSRFGSGRRRRATSHRLEASIDWDDDDCDDDDDSRRGRASGEDDDDETRETRGDDDDGEDAFDGTVGGTSARGTPKLGRRDDDDAFDANDGDDVASERWTNDHERGPDGERTTRGENRDDRYDAAERDAGFPTRGDARAKLALWTL